MPVFKYKGYRADGRSAGGILDAESPRVARLKLRKGGIFPTDLHEQDRSESPGRTSSVSVGGSAVLKGADLSLLTRQLGTLLVAGLPLVDAIGVLIDQNERKAVQTLLAEIREQIREGRSLSAALAAYPRDFSPLYMHMIEAGEASGALDQVLLQLADFLEQQDALKHKIVNATLYPALMLCVGVGVLFFLMTFVIPKITAVFADLHQALPWPTQVLMSVSAFLGAFWPLLIAGGGLGAIALRRWVRTPAGIAWRDRVVLSLPVIGEVARMVAVSRLTHTLATMLASGVPLLDALTVAKRVMNNVVLERAVETARENIREGESIADPLKRSGQFPPLVTHMIAVGERSGDMEDMLRKVSQIYDAETDRTISRLTALMEPIMILIMGVIVFCIVLAILLPIFQMSQIVR